MGQTHAMMCDLVCFLDVKTRDKETVGREGQMEKVFVGCLTC